MEQCTFGLTDLSAETQIMLAERTVARQTSVWHGEVPQVGSDERFQTCLCPFVKTFEQRESEGVLDIIVTHLVEDTVALQFLIIEISVEVIG